MNKKGMLVVLSAPSGCGKDTVFKELSKVRADVCESISATTRQPREGEKDGVNYFFKTDDEFKEMISNDGLLEYAQYNGCYYGTPVCGVEKSVKEGKICFLIIEVQGAKHIMEKCPDAVSIFLMPPSIECLKDRLVKRNTDSNEMILNRIKIAEEEIKSSSNYKYVVVNNDLEKAVDDINQILCNELNKRNAQ